MSDQNATRARLVLEREANRTRERLLDTLSELDNRRHEVTEHPGELIKAVALEHLRPIAIATGTLILGVAGLIGWSVYRLATQAQRRREERWRALRRWWNHPERIARRAPEEAPLAWQLGRKILLSAVGFAAVELTKRTVARALPRVEARNEGLPRSRVVVRTLPT